MLVGSHKPDRLKCTGQRTVPGPPSLAELLPIANQIQEAKEAGWIDVQDRQKWRLGQKKRPTPVQLLLFR